MDEDVHNRVKHQTSMFGRQASSSLKESSQYIPHLVSIAENLAHNTESDTLRKMAAVTLESYIDFWPNVGGKLKSVYGRMDQIRAEWGKLHSEALMAFNDINKTEQFEAYIERMLTILDLEKELEQFRWRRTLAFSTVQVPAFSSIIGVAGAVKQLVGADANQELDLLRIGKAILSDVVGIVFPVKDTLLEISRQTNNRINATIDSLNVGVRASDKFFRFGEACQKITIDLNSYEQQIESSLKDLEFLAKKDVADFIKKLASLAA